MQILDCKSHPDAVRHLVERRWEVHEELERKVREIVSAVKDERDIALRRYAAELDCPVIESVGITVSPEEIEAAYSEVGKKFLKALRTAHANIERFHNHQVQKSWKITEKGMRLEQRFSALQRAGIYVPGGKASYPSSVLMNAVPASVAGVDEIVMVTPSDRDGKIAPGVLVAAAEAGVTEIYRVGGAQAIAALAFGTETIRRADKITGPGNAYVTMAKKLVYGRVGIDALAGPTELVVVADESACPGLVAADMIAQAEHDETATAICITNSTQLAQRVELAIGLQMEQMPRRDIIRSSLEAHGAIVLVGSLKDAAAIVNEFAPEHLELLVKNPEKTLERVTCAGAVFLGPWSTEAMGDYIAGPNHTLPTLGTARFSSALSVSDFMRFTNVIEIGRKRFLKLSSHVEVLAEAEGLYGHAASVHIRKTGG
ncbi:MAG: histidinol dehydrogenase [Bacteroidota bacterium]